MHPRVLKDVVEQIRLMLTNIIYSSLESEQIPEEWREANLTPLFLKKGREIEEQETCSFNFIVGGNCWKH